MRFAYAIGLLALALTATSPARADYAVVQFGDGYCRIWWDSADTLGASAGRNSLSGCPIISPPAPHSIAKSRKAPVTRSEDADG
jgi:hypothetical protein